MTCNWEPGYRLRWMFDDPARYRIALLRDYQVSIELSQVGNSKRDVIAGAGTL